MKENSSLRQASKGGRDRPKRERWGQWKMRLTGSRRRGQGNKRHPLRIVGRGEGLKKKNPYGTVRGRWAGESGLLGFRDEHLVLSYKQRRLVE